MNHKFLFGVLLIGMAAWAMPAQKQNERSATSSLRRPAAPSLKFAASTDKTFDQLMDEAMSVMHSRMDNAMATTMATGDPDHEFVTMMIPHHQGAIDMAKAMLLYGKDEQLKRLAQEIIADQQNEVQLMQLWLVKHPKTGRAKHVMTMQKSGKRRITY